MQIGSKVRTYRGEGVLIASRKVDGEVVEGLVRYGVFPTWFTLWHIPEKMSEMQDEKYDGQQEVPTARQREQEEAFALTSTKTKGEANE